MARNDSDSPMHMQSSTRSINLANLHQELSERGGRRSVRLDHQHGGDGGDGSDHVEHSEHSNDEHQHEHEHDSAKRSPSHCSSYNNNNNSYNMDVSNHSAIVDLSPSKKQAIQSRVRTRRKTQHSAWQNIQKKKAVRKTSVLSSLDFWESASSHSHSHKGSSSTDLFGYVSPPAVAKNKVAVVAAANGASHANNYTNSTHSTNNHTSTNNSLGSPSWHNNMAKSIPVSPARTNTTVSSYSPGSSSGSGSTSASVSNYRKATSTATTLNATGATTTRRLLPAPLHPHSAHETTTNNTTTSKTISKTASKTNNNKRSPKSNTSASFVSPTPSTSTSISTTYKSPSAADATSTTSASTSASASRRKSKHNQVQQSPFAVSEVAPRDGSQKELLRRKQQLRYSRRGSVTKHKLTAEVSRLQPTTNTNGVNKRNSLDKVDSIRTVGTASRRTNTSNKQSITGTAARGLSSRSLLSEKSQAKKASLLRGLKNATADVPFKNDSLQSNSSRQEFAEEDFPSEELSERLYVSDYSAHDDDDHDSAQDSDDFIDYDDFDVDSEDDDSDHDDYGLSLTQRRRMLLRRGSNGDQKLSIDEAPTTTVDAATSATSTTIDAGHDHQDEEEQQQAPYGTYEKYTMPLQGGDNDDDGDEISQSGSVRCGRRSRAGSFDSVHSIASTSLNDVHEHEETTAKAPSTPPRMARRRAPRRNSVVIPTSTVSQDASYASDDECCSIVSETLSAGSLDQASWHSMSSTASDGRTTPASIIKAKTNRLKAKKCSVASIAPVAAATTTASRRTSHPVGSTADPSSPSWLSPSNRTSQEKARLRRGSEPITSPTPKAESRKHIPGRSQSTDAHIDVEPTVKPQNNKFAISAQPKSLTPPSNPRRRTVSLQNNPNASSMIAHFQSLSGKETSPTPSWMQKDVLDAISPSSSSSAAAKPPSGSRKSNLKPSNHNSAHQQSNGQGKPILTPKSGGKVKLFSKLKKIPKAAAVAATNKVRDSLSSTSDHSNYYNTNREFSNSGGRSRRDSAASRNTPKKAKAKSAVNDQAGSEHTSSGSKNPSRRSSGPSPAFQGLLNLRSPKSKKKRVSLNGSTHDQRTPSKRGWSKALHKKGKGGLPPLPLPDDDTNEHTVPSRRESGGGRNSTTIETSTPSDAKLSAAAAVNKALSIASPLPFLDDDEDVVESKAPPAQPADDIHPAQPVSSVVPGKGMPKDDGEDDGGSAVEKTDAAESETDIVSPTPAAKVLSFVPHQQIPDLAAALSASAQKRRSNRRASRVTFGTITIQEYPILLGDNPSVTCGAPVTIDWIPQESYTLDFHLYERMAPKRHATNSAAATTISPPVAAAIAAAEGQSPESARATRATRPQRRRRRDMVLSQHARAQILLRAGVSLTDIVQAGLEVQRIQKERADSLRKQQWEVVRGIWNKAGSAFSRIVMATDTSLHPILYPASPSPPDRPTSVGAKMA